MEVNQSSTSATEQNDDVGVVTFIIISSVGIIGCFIAVLVLGKEFFSGRTSTLVIVAALTWVDFHGVLTTSSIVFHGLIVKNGWIGKYPQCQIQVSLKSARQRCRLLPRKKSECGQHVSQAQTKLAEKLFIQIYCMASYHYCE